MIKTFGTISRLCTVLAVCGSIGTTSVAHAALIDFDTAPSYPALVDDYANLYPGVTFASNNQWYTATINNEYYQSVNGQAIHTRAGAPLSIGFQPAARDVAMDLGANRLEYQMTVRIEGYLDGLLVFSNSFVTQPTVVGGGEEVRAQTIGIVDKLVIAREAGETAVNLDDLSFTAVPEPTGWVVVGIGMMLIGRLTRRVACPQP